LLQLEKDPGLRAIYTASLKRTWDFERTDGCRFGILFMAHPSAARATSKPQSSPCGEIPLDFIEWKIATLSAPTLIPRTAESSVDERVLHTGTAAPTNSTAAVTWASRSNCLALALLDGRYHRFDRVKLFRFWTVSIPEDARQ